MNTDRETMEGICLSGAFPICDSPLSFGVVLARMEFTKKLTVMFYSEVIGDEVNENTILGKSGRKRGGVSG